MSFLLGQQSKAIRAFHLLRLLTATPEYEILLILSVDYIPEQRHNSELHEVISLWYIE